MEFAISYSDVLFACAFWACGRLALAAVGKWSVVGRTVSLLFVTIASFWCVYAVVSVNAFDDVPSSLLRRSPASFEGESVASRLERRKRNWIADVQFIDRREDR